MTRLMTAVYLALMIAPFLALLIITPYVLLRYRRTRNIHVVRCEQFYLMTVFTLCAYFMTMLPFPTMESVLAMKGGSMQLIPFYCVYDFALNSSLNMADWTTIFPALGGSIFLGVVFNIIMLMPLGFLMRSLYPIKARTAVLVGFGVSLFFELTQLSGLFFIYPRPYRVFDVDDLIQNTLGVWLGFVIQPLFHRFHLLPSARERQVVRQGGEISMVRRMAAGAVDQLLLLIAALGATLGLRALLPALHRFSGPDTLPLIFACYMAAAMVLAGYCFVFHGKTPGMQLTGMQLRSLRPGPLRLWQTALRQALYGIIFTLPLWIGYFITISGRYGAFRQILCTFASACCAYGYVCYLLSLFLHVITHGEPLIHDKLSSVHLGFDPEAKVVQKSTRLFSGSLEENAIEPASQAVCSLLEEQGIEKKKALRVQFMTEGILLEWMESGLHGHHYTVQKTRQLGRTMLLITVPGPNIPLHREPDSFLDALGGTRLSFDLYYTGDANVFAVEVP